MRHSTLWAGGVKGRPSCGRPSCGRPSLAQLGWQSCFTSSGDRESGTAGLTVMFHFLWWAGVWHSWTDSHVSLPLVTESLAQLEWQPCFTSSGDRESGTAGMAAMFHFLWWAGVWHSWNGSHVSLPLVSGSLAQLEWQPCFTSSGDRESGTAGLTVMFHFLWWPPCWPSGKVSVLWAADTGSTPWLLLTVCWLVGCLTSQQHASVSQGRICSDNFTCCYTEIEGADPNFHLTLSQYTDTTSRVISMLYSFSYPSLFVCWLLNVPATC